MKNKLKISFLNEVKRSSPGNKSGNNALSMLSIPIMLFIIGPLFVFGAGMISIWQWLTTSKEERHKQKKYTLEQEIQSKKWHIFTSTDKVVIEQKLAGSLPWDSGDYLYLKSNPKVAELEDKIFGDWLLVDFGGIFLQRWNNKNGIVCELVFLDINTLQITKLLDQIQSKDWKTEKMDSDNIKFTFITSENDINYIVERTRLIN